MKHDEFLKKWIGKKYRENVTLNYQCVALDKVYYQDVHNIVWLSFGGSAINAWNWKWNLETLFDRVEIPQQGDILFFGTTPTNPYWHTGIFHDQKTILEQNWGRWNGSWFWTDAIRLAKMPTNMVWAMRLKTLNHPVIEKHLLQGSNPDCSLSATVNCYNLNKWPTINQEQLNDMMTEYVNKNPRDAYYFLKEKGYDIKIIPLTFEKAKIRLNKWSAVVLFIKWDWPRNSHWTCCKQIDGKYWIYDSTRPDRYELTDIDTPYKQWVFTDTCFQVR